MSKWGKVAISEFKDSDDTMKNFHNAMQKLRKSRKNVSLKSMLSAEYGAEMTPEKFYKELGIDMADMTVEKMLNTSELNRWLFPEVFRDAIIVGLEYTPFYRNLIAAEETIVGTGMTMPFMDFTTIGRDAVRLRDTNEGATITEGDIIAWSQKTVTIHKKARGLKQTYESIQWTPIDLAAIFFQELGTQLGADLDRDLINIALNGDQTDGSEAPPVIGATVAGTLAYADLTRAWIRFKRIGRNSSAMLASEADVVTILNMPEFQRTVNAGATAPSPVTLNVVTPLPTSQDIFVHDSIPTGKIVFVDKARAFIQLTSMPLLIESERIVSRQIEGEYVSITTGFGNIFKDGRMVLDYTTNLTTNPGPVPPTV